MAVLGETGDRLDRGLRNKVGNSNVCFESMAIGCEVLVCRTIKPPHPGPPNYTYSTSPICKTHDSHQAFTILEVGGSLPVPYCRDSWEYFLVFGVPSFLRNS